MVTEAQASNTLAVVRRFFDFGPKSNNKAYTTDRNKLILPTVSQALSSDERKKLEGRYNKRNNNIPISFEHTTKNRDIFQKGMTPYQAGEYLWTTKCPVGNCGEMAAVALYVAIKFHGVPMNEAFLWTYTAQGRSFPPVQGGFTHQVAFLGAKQNGWVVDPWCNLCCRHDDYENKDLRAKLSQWEGQGKRINVPGKLGGWLKPTHAAITGIMGKNAGFNSCGADKMPT